MAGCPDLHVARACSVACAKEAQVIKRLLYKNKSQHRRDRNFQKLQKVSELAAFHKISLFPIAIVRTYSLLTALERSGTLTGSTAMRIAEERVVESI